jgi:antitoxin component of MazEF toxin-antitoxin module
MGYPTKMQLIKRQKSEQWYVNLPSAIAQAMDFQRGEVVEWSIEDKKKMVLMRSDKAVDESKKKPKTEP